MNATEYETVTTKAQQRRSYQQLIQEVGDYWEEVVKSEEIPIMIGNFVDKVVWTVLSPRVSRITVHWSDPEWGIEEFLFIRSHGPGPAWATEEDQAMYKHYPTMPRAELLQLIPNRTWFTLLLRATQLKISRIIQEYSDCPKDICWNDYIQMQTFGISRKEIKDGTFRQLFCTFVRSRNNEFPRHPL